MSSLSAIKAQVVIASNRAAAGIYPDTTGPLIEAWLHARGAVLAPTAVVADGAPVAAALRSALAAGNRLIVTSGGTGLTPTDRTPEATREVVDFEVPGIAEAIRAAGVAAGVPTAMLSRGLVGVAGTSLIVNLPGSPGGVRDGLGVLDAVVGHGLEQILGSDHPRSP